MHARYRFDQVIGAGGMGTITRAYDRLTNTWVALKQLSLEMEANLAASTSAGQAVRLALAEEFRLLATLRHPYIVSVLDYGFAADKAFFTMEYLDVAQPFTQAAHQQPLATQLQWLGQLLQALEYLRRRQVVHRDLKPANVLVQQGQVKVLDFGLAALEGQFHTTAGSLFYMAPETLLEQPPTHSSDLYAVGLIAYETLVGQHPFAEASATALIQHILTTTPDYARLPGPPALQTVVARLLAKDPAARYATAAETLAALAAASGEALPLETQATRTSLLHAAQFVGRTPELTQLIGALAQAQAGQGSAWLLGGESGVGKSRLLDELRIQALVRRAWVWQGQAVSEGGAPMQLWRNILRWLVLVANPAEAEASILKPFVPQIDELLGQPVSAAPTLEGPAEQDRLCGVVLTLLRQVAAQQPLVLILEDLHWAGPLSRKLLAWVMQVVGELPLLIVGTYRDDEQPHLPQTLPVATCLALKRLTAPHVAELAHAILGQPTATLAPLAQFLFEQTEGNTLFVLEVLRSLAEEAGSLSAVQVLGKPTARWGGSIQAVIQRRLARIGPQDYPWLEVAAVVGRELDLQLLQHLAPAFDWAAWLSRCAEAAVLEPQGAAWRFAHDQLRQGVLAGLPVDRERALHQTLAVAFEQVYTQDLTPHLHQLVHHYAYTEHWEKQGHYLWLAGEAAYNAHDCAQAAAYYEQLKPLGDRVALPLKLELHYGLMLDRLGRWPEAEAVYRAALTRGEQRQDTMLKLSSQKALGSLVRRQGHYPAALNYLQAAQQLAAENNDPLAQAQVHTEMASVHMALSDFALSRTHAEQAVALARVAAHVPTQVTALSILGHMSRRRGDFATVQTALEESLALRQQLGDKMNIAMGLYDLAFAKSVQGDYAAAQQYGTACLALYREMGNKGGAAITLNDLGYYMCEAGNYPQAQAVFTEGLALQRELGSQTGVVVLLENLGLALYLQGQDYAAAIACFAESLALAQTIGEPLMVITDLEGLAACYSAVGQAQRAVQLLAAAEQLGQKLNITLNGEEAKFYKHTLANGQRLLAPAAFEQAWATGSAMSSEAALALALADTTWAVLPGA